MMNNDNNNCQKNINSNNVNDGTNDRTRISIDNNSDINDDNYQ